MIGQNHRIPTLTTNIFEKPSHKDIENANTNINREKLLTQNTSLGSYAHVIQTNVNDTIANRNTNSKAIELENALMEYRHRLGSYLTTKGVEYNFYNSLPTYLIYGVNTNGKLSVTYGLTGDWREEHLENTLSKTILSIQTTSPSELLICTTDFTLYHCKLNIMNLGPQIPPVITNLTEKTGKSFKKVAEAPDKSLIGIGTDNNLYVNYNSQNNDKWMGPIQAINGNIKIIDFAICPDDSVYGVGSDYQIYSNPSYQTMNDHWTPLSPAVSNVQAITIAPDGKLFAVMNGGSGRTGTVSYLESWNNPHGSWLPLGSSCCFTSLTTINMMPERLREIYRADIGESDYTDLLQYTQDMKKLVANNQQYFGTVGQQVGDSVNTSHELNGIYNKLLADQKSIDETLLEFQEIDDDYNVQNLYVESQNMMFRVVFVIFLILLIFTVKEMTGSQSLFNDPLSYFFFACVLLASIGLFNGSFGFFLFGILCLGLVLFLTSMNR